MVDRIDALVARLDAVAVPALQARVDALGEVDSGAYNFYLTRLARGTLFADYDAALARKLEASGVPAIVHDIGGGIGNLSWLLAALGAQARCLEHDRRRHAAAIALLRAVRSADPRTAARVRALRTSFPDPALESEGATAVVTNLVFTTGDAERAAILGGLRGYAAAIVDIDRFLHTSGPEEREATVAEFAAAGLAGEPWLEVGRSACFWRFVAA